MKRRNKKRKNSGAPRWMVTYSDMVTLILVFFVLLFSMSQIDLRKFQSLTESFQGRAVLDFMSSATPSDDHLGMDMNNHLDLSGGLKDLLDEVDELENEYDEEQEEDLD